MDQARAFEILGLKPGATRFEVRQAYHDLLHIWQPDRVGKNLRLQKRAMAQIALINEAFEIVEAALPKAPEADSLALEPEDVTLGDLPKPSRPAATVVKPAFKSPTTPPPPVPVLDMDYVPDGPPPPKVPLSARIRETRAEVKSQLAQGVATAIPFSRRNIILACIAVVCIPVSAFFITQYFRDTHRERDLHSTEPLSNSSPRSTEPPSVRPHVAETTPATTPAVTVATPDPQPPVAVTPVPATIAAVPVVATDPPPVPVANPDPAVEPATVAADPGPDPRLALIAELAKLHVTPPADSSIDQLTALLGRANMARNLAAAGFKIDPLKVSQDLLNQYQVRADLAAQINQLANTKILASDFTLPQLRDMRLGAGLVAKIAENGYKVDINRYTRNELEDMYRRSAIAQELHAKYGMTVDILAHSVPELNLMLKNAQDQRATSHP